MSETMHLDKYIKGLAVECLNYPLAFAETLMERLSNKKLSWTPEQQDKMVWEILEKASGAYPTLELLSCDLDPSVLEKHFPSIQEKIKRMSPNTVLTYLPYQRMYSGYPQNNVARALVESLEDNLAKVDAKMALVQVMQVLKSYNGAEAGFQDKAKSLYEGAINRLLTEAPETAIPAISEVFLDSRVDDSAYCKRFLKDTAEQVIIPSIKDDEFAAAQFQMILSKSGISIDGFSDQFAESAISLRDDWADCIMQEENIVSEMKQKLKAAQRELDGLRDLLTNDGLCKSFADALKMARETAKADGTLTPPTTPKASGTAPQYRLIGWH